MRYKSKQVSMIEKGLVALLTTVLSLPTFLLFYDFNIFSIGVLSLVIISAALTFFLVQDSAKKNIFKKVLASIPLTLFWMFTSVSDVIEKPHVGILAIIYAFSYFFIMFYLIVNYFTIQYVVKEKRFALVLPFVMFLIIEGVWLLYWLAYRPGIFTVDSSMQFNQGMGLTRYSAWHPPIHTLLLKMNYALFGTMNYYFLIFITLTALLIVFILYRLTKAGMPNIFFVLISLFYAFYPINGYYMNTFWKDIPYMVLLLVYTYLLFEISKSNGKILKNIPFVFSFTLLTFLVIEFRKNALLVMVVVSLMLIIKYRAYWKQLLFPIVLPLIGFMIIQGPVFNHYNVKKGPSTEALAVPMQQIGATYKYGKIPLESKEFFDKMLPEEEWKEKYKELSVDPLKFSPKFNQEFAEENIGLFLKHWAKTLPANFDIYVEAYLKHTRALWQFNKPEDIYTYVISTTRFTNNPTFGHSLAVEVYKPSKENDNAYKHYLEEFEGETNLMSKEEYYAKIENIEQQLMKEQNTNNKKLFDYFNKNADVIRENTKYFANPGVVAILILLCSIILLLKKNFIIVLPVLINYFTLLIAAPATDFRYLYGSAFTLPILLVMLKVSFDEENKHGTTN